MNCCFTPRYPGCPQVPTWVKSLRRTFMHLEPGAKKPPRQWQTFPHGGGGLALTAGSLPIAWYPGDFPRLHSRGYPGL